MVLKIYNTLTRKKEVFEPLEKGKLKIYTCGQTVYDDVHIGNARAYSNWDMVVRYLRWKGFKVFHVQNFTDVGHMTSDEDEGEDKIEKRGRERGINPWELINTQIRKYWQDIDELNIERPNISPLATAHIPEMIELTETLIKKGFAYEIKGSIYFDTSKFNDYGKLAHLDMSKWKPGARVEINPDKKHPCDFALWKRAEKGRLMKWTSPWGDGYPGWHIECSVMAIKYLGETLDIHGGGIDHIPIHHINEIAQSEAATGKKFVNYWMHSHFLTINGEKMSKSKGNFFTARELIEKHGAEVVRMFLISSHYRKPIDFTEKSIIDAGNNLEKIYTTLNLIERSNGGTLNDLTENIEKLKREFEISMDDDFNVPGALTAIFDFLREVNKSLDAPKKELEEAAKTIKELCMVLGLKLEARTKATVEIESLINLILELREQFRKKTDYETSDRIREELKKIKIQIDDTKDNPTWRFS
ncbi:MAG: cysteine--tRNA ligase [Candidatus Altiarchaeales archaeon HGW-Altiarchaeales-2]|nr:MAG: cysteine--tRNA ligase [Candidatus Altiarchaeales archaeon HGW-Altiarchaeales-2]